jgi:hypothetical protein
LVRPGGRPTRTLTATTNTDPTASERQALGPNQIPVERTHAWGNQYGKLRWCTQRRRLVVKFWLAGAAIVSSRLVRCAWTCYRRERRPGRP